MTMSTIYRAICSHHWPSPGAVRQAAAKDTERPVQAAISYGKKGRKVRIFPMKRMRVGGWLLQLPVLLGISLLIVRQYSPRQIAAPSGSAAQSFAESTPLAGTAKLSAIRTVFIILEENHNWSDIAPSNAPYTHQVLVPMGAHTEQYYNPPGMHPSAPNYIWLEAGSNLGIVDNSDPSINHRSTTDHLASYLNRAGISWKAYPEDIDGTNCPLANVRKYAVRHNPFVYFDDITDRNNPFAAECITHIRPFSELEGDLENNTVARYNFIVPNLNNDMHDGTIATADAWLSREVPKILASRAYRDAGALFITWDEGEGEGGDGPIGMIVLSPFVKQDYSNSTYYTHSSTIKTFQEIFGVAPLLREAATATDLSDLFDPVLLDAIAIHEQGIVNNASCGLASTSLAPGTIAAIFGINLTDGTSCLAPSCYPKIGPDGRLNTILAGTQVLVNGSPAPIYYASPSQVGIQLPSELSGNSATVQVVVGGGASPPTTVSIAPVSPGIFSFSADGRGAGAITHPDGSAVSTTNPAHPGEVVILYATGLGAVSPPAHTGTVTTVPAVTISPASVLIEGTRVIPEYAGLSGCCVGLNQLNFRLPMNVRRGDDIQVAIEIAGIRSNLVTLAVH